MNPNSATATTSTPAPQAPTPQSALSTPHAASGNPQSSICNPQSDNLHTRGLALFATLMELVEILLTIFVDTLAGNHALPNSKALPLLGKAIQCLFSLTRLRLTLLRAPQRFTARQVLRLSRAFDKIRYLTGRALDFSLWTSLTPDQLDQLSPKKSPSQSPSNQQSALRNPQSAIATPSTPPVHPVPNVNEVPAATVTATPGATLARICENLVELATELGLPHHPETGFLPAQSPSPSPSQSSSVHSAHNVQKDHPVHPVHPVHSAFPLPPSLSPALRRQLTTPIRAPD